MYLSGFYSRHTPADKEVVQPPFVHPLPEILRYFFFTFLVLFVKSEKCVPTNVSATIHESKFLLKHLFFQFLLPHNIVFLLFVYLETYFTFCLSVAANSDITILSILAAM